MSMTPACVLLGFLAALMLISKSSASPINHDRDLQESIHKRIFCNFYGCGQKRSGGNDFLAEDKAEGNGLDMNTSEERDREEQFLLQNLERVPHALEPTGDRNGDLLKSPVAEKYLWESLKNRLSTRRIKKRNI